VAKKRAKQATTTSLPVAGEPAPTPSNRALGWILAVGLGFPLAALLYAPGVNGPWYWRWTCQSLDPTLFFVAAAVAGVVLCSILSVRLPAVTTVALLFALHVGLTLSFAALHPSGISLIGERAADEGITSYHTEAVRADDVSSLLREFPERLPDMVGHARTHPPGPILYYRFWNALLGPSAGAQWGGVFLVVLAGLLVPASFLLASRLAGPEAGRAAAALTAVLPGIVAMPGGLDSVYPAVTAGLALTWLGTLEGGRRQAVAFGGLLIMGMLFTHAFLVLGVFFVLAAVLSLRWNPNASTAGVGKAVAIAALVVVGFFGLAAVLLGYDHLAALQAAMGVQASLETGYFRPWSSTVLWDPYDFALASGWGVTAVLVYFLWDWRGRGFEDPTGRLRVFALAGLATILVVDLTGLLRAEVARVWLFLQPFVVVLVGCELSRWTIDRRNLFLMTVLFAAVVLRTRMLF